MSLISMLYQLMDEIHLYLGIIAVGAFIIWEIWAHVSKHERVPYRAYLWIIVMFLLAANLSIVKLLHKESSHHQVEDALEQIASKGSIRIGISHVAWGPFLCLDEEKVKLTGFDIEVAEQVAEAIRDEVKRRGGEKFIRHNFILFDWIPLLQAVQENDVDFAISAITRNRERELKYSLSFSDPYYKTNPSYATFEKNSDDNPILTGRKAIVIEGTTSFDVAKQKVGNGTVQEEANWFVAFNKFRQSRLEYPIIFDDDTFMRYRLYRMKLMKEVDIKKIDGQDEEYGIAVNYKQQDLLRLINESLSQLKKNRFLDRLEDKWLKAAPERCLKEVG